MTKIFLAGVSTVLLAISAVAADVPTIAPHDLGKMLDQITLKNTQPICTVNITIPDGPKTDGKVPNPGTCDMMISYTDLPHTYYRLPEDRMIVVYSQYGKYGEKAVQFLRDHGYDKAVNLAGGQNAWRKLRYRLP